MRQVKIMLAFISVYILLVSNLTILLVIPPIILLSIVLLIITIT